MGRMIEDVKEYPGRLKRLGMQTAAALLIGAVCGLLGTRFHIAVHQAEHFRQGHPWMIWLMPAAGLLIVAVYKLTQAEGHGTDSVVRAAQEGDMPHMQLIPAIFIGTVLTHLTGGSAGREGAALQMGGRLLCGPAAEIRQLLPQGLRDRRDGSFLPRTVRNSSWSDCICSWRSACGDDGI